MFYLFMLKNNEKGIYKIKEECFVLYAQEHKQELCEKYEMEFYIVFFVAVAFYVMGKNQFCKIL